MLISTHVLVGGLIGSALAQRLAATGFGSLAVAGVLGVASHFACDALPHWGLSGASGPRERAFLTVAVPDGLVGLTLLGAVLARTPRHLRPVVAAATLGACLPDSDKIGELVVGRSPWPGWLDAWHGRIQRESPHRLPGDIAKATALALLVFWRSTA